VERLTCALSAGDVDFLRDLIRSGANITHAADEDSWPALHWAVHWRQHAVSPCLVHACQRAESHGGVRLKLLAHALITHLVTHEKSI
jgi:ankyrin repeat protein